jgi:hypothetical protein
MACGPGRPALGGRWVRLRGGRARPHRGPGMRLADRRGVGQGSDLQEQWWARQGLNLRLLPCQQTTGNRCAKRRCRRSALTVEVEVKRSLCVQLSALFKLRGGAVEPGQRPPMISLTLSLSAPLEGDKTPPLGASWARSAHQVLEVRTVVFRLRREETTCAPMADWSRLVGGGDWES